MIANIFRRIHRLSIKNYFNYGELTYTTKLTPTVEYPGTPTYRLIDLEGNLLDQSHKYDANYLTKILKQMIFIDEMDDLLLKVKGQGKISFYMTSFGQHACIVGSAAALEARDLVFTQYREQGAHMWRGLTIEEVVNQCMGNAADLGGGRQMPVHYGSRALNNPTVSSPLGTQIPQASGSGYAFRTAGEDKVSACYFGEGAASEGDFSVALNFAATLRCQTLFLCRNNKYAISTPSSDQYIADGVIPRAISYNIASTRVDGNDTLACLEATRKAREYIVKEGKPFFIEFMTYRVGDHSTSDNSALYRKEDERNEWKQKNDPIKRLTKFLHHIKHNEIPDEAEVRKAARKTITETLHKSQKIKLPAIKTLFDDVYDKLPRHLEEQREEILDHMEKYGDKYDFLDKYEK